MPKKRAKITRKAAGDMYDDVIDRVTADVDEAREAKRKDAAPEQPPLVKATVYLTPDDVLAIDKIQSDEFRATGKKPRRSAVVCRAIRLYAGQYEPPTSE